MVELACSASLQPRSVEGVNSASDHFPFQLWGIDALWCTRQPDRHDHTAEERLDWLDFREAFEVWPLHLVLIEDIAFSC